MSTFNLADVIKETALFEEADAELRAAIRSLAGDAEDPITLKHLLACQEAFRNGNRQRQNAFRADEDGGPEIPLSTSLFDDGTYGSWAWERTGLPKAVQEQLARIARLHEGLFGLIDITQADTSNQLLNDEHYCSYTSLPRKTLIRLQTAQMCLLEQMDKSIHLLHGFYATQEKAPDA